VSELAYAQGYAHTQVCVQTASCLISGSAATSGSLLEVLSVSDSCLQLVRLHLATRACASVCAVAKPSAPAAGISALRYTNMESGYTYTQQQRGPREACGSPQLW
jgi:hypothetical protein